MKHDKDRAAKIAALNDSFRHTLQGGKLVLTDRVHRSIHQSALVALVREFDDFTEDNDPHGEHDFGAVALFGDQYFWKIDYFDLDYHRHSVEPANALVTNRVMTIMHADEY